MNERVLFMVPLTTYLKKETGGVFKYIQYLKNTIEKIGYKVDINNIKKGFLIKDYIAIHIFTSSISITDWLGIDHNNIIITPVYDRSFTALQSKTAQLIGNLPFMYTSENIRLKMFRKSRMILTFSDYERVQILKNFNIGHNKVRVLGADYQPHEVSKKIRKNFLFVGDISNPRKNLLRICKIFSTINANLTIIGKCHQSVYTNRLLKIIDKTRNIEYKGKVSNQQLTEAYHACDALILVSQFEGFGYAAIEANQNNLPVLATVIGGTRELLGSNGIYVNPFSNKSIKVGIRRMMNGELDDVHHSLPLGTEFEDIMERSYHGE